MHQDSREGDVPLVDNPPETKVVGPLSGKPPSDVKLGPRRRAPVYYIGETYARGRGRKGSRAPRSMQYPDVERNANGSLPGIRNKAARRIIRNAFGRKLSRISKGLDAARAMKMQAREIASESRVEKIDDHHNGNRSTRFASTSGDTRWARRLFDKELAIHQPVYAPGKKELRAMRTKARALKRRQMKGASVNDAIGDLVDRMQKP